MDSRFLGVGIDPALVSKRVVFVINDARHEISFVTFIISFAISLDKRSAQMQSISHDVQHAQTDISFVSEQLLHTKKLGQK